MHHTSWFSRADARGGHERVDASARSGVDGHHARPEDLLEQ